MATVVFEGTAELATLSHTFTVAGVATDPTTVSLAVTTPAGTSTTYTYAASQITKSATGVYTKDIPCSEDGVWQYVWTGTGAVSDVAAGTFTVQGTDLQKLYCTPEELKSRRGIATTDTADDTEIMSACRTASRWIDKYCKRQFWRGAATRTFTPTSLYRLKPGDLVSITTLKTDGAGDGTFETTWSAPDYQLLPVNALTEAEPEPYTEIRSVGGYTFPYPCQGYPARTDLVEIAGVFGWPAVPSNVKEAAAILAGDFLKLGGMTFGIAGYGEYGAVRARANPIAIDLLKDYRRRPVRVA